MNTKQRAEIWKEYYDELLYTEEQNEWMSFIICDLHNPCLGQFVVLGLSFLTLC